MVRTIFPSSNQGSPLDKYPWPLIETRISIQRSSKMRSVLAQVVYMCKVMACRSKLERVFRGVISSVEFSVVRFLREALLK